MAQMVDGMIPILYEANETNFTSNGLGRLSDAISCKVIEERNSVYELEMQYHVDGVHYSDITEDRLILAKPFEGGLNQAFRIYKISKPLNGVVTVYAEHISYLLNRMVVKPFTAGSCTGALVAIEDNFVTNCPFTFWTDKSVTAEMKLVEPHTAREILGGMQGSILDTYNGGDYEFNNFEVRLHSHRGTDKGVSFHYGKNITSLTNENDVQNAYTGIVPYWKDSEDNITLLTELVVWSTHRNDYFYPLIKIVDFSSDFDEKPTEAQLRSKANTYITQNSGWNPTNNIKISFVALWQTEEYKNVANLERVQMGDSVTVIYDRLGVNVKMRVVKTDYDVLGERYNAIEVGDASTNLAKAVAETDKNLDETADEITSEYKKAVAHATKMIQGGLGGHIVFNTDAQGHPNELLIMDTDDKSTAINVWRFNLGGLGHSHSGYDGPFDDVALTADGQINASRILTGYMSANRVRAGVLQSTNGKLVFDLDAAKLDVKSGSTLNITSDNFKVSPTSVWISGSLESENASTGIKTVVNNGTLKVYYNNNYIGELGRVQYNNKTTLAIKMDNSLDYAKGIMMSRGNTPLYMANPDGRSLDLTGYGFEHYFNGNLYSTERYKTKNGYGFGSGEVSGNPDRDHYCDVGCGLYVGGNGEPRTDVNAGGLYSRGNCDVRGSLYVSGEKQRIVGTDNYGIIKMHAFETPTPTFADIGSGVIGDDGNCYVFIEPQMQEVCAEMVYQVLLQGIGGTVQLEEKDVNYFKVSGTPGMKFDWFMMLPQRGYEDERFDNYIPPEEQMELAAVPTEFVRDEEPEDLLLDLLNDFYFDMLEDILNYAPDILDDAA